MTHIKTNAGRGWKAEASTRGVRLVRTAGCIPLDVDDMTPDQAAALVFALERAMEAHEVMALREAT